MANSPKLTEEQRQQIRLEYASGMYSYAALAAKYDVHQNTIFRICKEETYLAQLESNRKYQQRNIQEIYERRKGSHKVYRLTLHKENDADVIDKLDSVENYSAYLRNLILADLNREEDK